MAIQPMYSFWISKYIVYKQLSNGSKVYEMANGRINDYMHNGTTIRTKRDALNLMGCGN